MVAKKYVLLSNLVIIVLAIAFFWLKEASATPQAGNTSLSMAPVTSGFTYQGQLENGGTPINDTCDMTFALFDDPTAGAQIGTIQTVTNLTVTDGLFTTVLNESGQFSTSAFTGQARWLQIGVRCPAGSGSFTPLSPRQALTATPYSLFSLSTGGLQGFPVSSSAPAANNVLQYDGTQWEPSAINLQRLFYLTTTLHDGNAPITACAAGYHMASMWEIHDLAALKYNTSLGYSATDSGSGAPASIAGWIRTGVPSFTNTVPGNANCNSWASDDPSHNGTRVNLQPQWASAGEFTSPWDATVQACSATSRVWCVQD
jgi:hypothetical protein